MARKVCPHCGFEQENGAECHRCGIVFDRFRSRLEARSRGSVYPVNSGKRGWGRRYRIFRWLMLAFSVAILALIFLHAPNPNIESTREAVEKAERKIREHAASSQVGRAHTLELDQGELNGWLDSHLALAPQEHGEKTIPEFYPDETRPTIEEVQSNVRDVKIELFYDSLRAHVVFDFCGIDLTLVLEGKIRVENGFLRFHATGGRLGLLPLPQASLKSAMRRLFDSPENREKFRLPPEVSYVGIRDGKLVLSTY